MRRVVVKYQVKESKGKELVDTFLASEAVKNIRKERGCKQYEYFISAEDSDHVLLIEMWENKECHEEHLSGPNMAPLGEIKAKYTDGQTVEVYDFD